MTRDFWAARVTGLVELNGGPDFDWDSVPEGDWEAAWLARQPATSFAAEILGVPEAELAQDAFRA